MSTSAPGGTMSTSTPSGTVSTSAPKVHVERLSLTVSGLDEDAGRTLARLVAAGLAPALTRAVAGTGLDHLRVEVDAPTADVDELAARIIDRVGRILARDRAFGPLGEEATL